MIEYPFEQAIAENLEDEQQDLKSQIISDNALLNLHTGLNVPGQDKLASVSVGRPPALTSVQLNNLYRSSNLIANLVNLLPDAITQEWVDYKCEENPDLQDWMQAKLDAIASDFNQALKQARLFGGACLVLHLDDFYRPGNSRPMNYSSINAYIGCQVLGIDQIHPHIINNDVFSPDYKKITYWKLRSNLHLVGSGERDKRYLVHSDRVLPFYGVKRLEAIGDTRVGRETDYGDSYDNDYLNWGDSVVLRAYKKLLNLDQSDDAIASSLQSFNQTVLFIHDLAKKTMQPEKREMVKQHLRTVAFLQSVLGILALDAEHERFEIMSRNYAQIPEILEHIKEMAAGSTDIPHTLLLNRSPSGITSGSSEKNDWARTVAARQKLDVLPQLQQLVQILHLCKDNPAGGLPPSSHQLVFPSILKLTEFEESELEEKKVTTLKLKAETLQNLITAGIAIDKALELVGL